MGNAKAIPTERAKGIPKGTKEIPKGKAGHDHPKEKVNANIVRNRPAPHQLQPAIGANGTSREYAIKATHASGCMARRLIVTDQQSHEIEIISPKPNPKPKVKPKPDAHAS